MSARDKMPPAVLLRIFQWYCHPQLVSHIEGDLLEEYQQRLRKVGKLRADLAFIIDIILLFRPGIIRPWQRGSASSLGIYKSYFVVGWRNLRRNGAYSVINVGGLAIGMAVAMLNGLWIWDELSFNKHFDNYERIARVAEESFFEGEAFLSTTMTYPLGIELTENYREDFQYIARSSYTNQILSAGDNKVTAFGLYSERALPHMLTLEMLEGNRDGLSKNQSVVLSSSVAKSLFGYENALGKTLRIGNIVDVTVYGVFKDFPKNTDLADVKFLASWDVYLSTNTWIEQRALSDWRNHFMQINVQLKEGASFENVTARIAGALKFDPEDAETARKFQKKLSLFPMSRWHLHGYSRGRLNPEPLRMVKLVSAIGLFILLLACINFMNLSTARSEKRAKEVGIRKTIGSVRSQLINQFFSESFLIVAFAFIGAVMLTVSALPAFNDLASKEIVMPWTNGNFWIICAAFVLTTSVLAGSYPSLYLSSFSPVKTLKGKIRIGRKASLPRQILVVAQFCISVILIICTAVVYQQIQFAKNRPVGYDRSGLLMVEKRSSDFFGKYDVLRAELKATGVVEEVSESLGPMTEVVSGNNGWDWKGRDPNMNQSFATLSVSHAHGRTVRWQFVAGEDFSIENVADSSGLIINEAAAKFMALQDPIGESVSWKWWTDGRILNYRIIGVIKNPLMDSPYGSDFPAVFYVKGFNGNPNWINIRLRADVSVSQALTKVEKVFRRVVPSAPFEYKFADEEFNRKFASEERVATLAGLFAGLAIFISCLGLLGLSSFVAEQRTKEIGIRKVLGATVVGLWRLLSADFVVLVLIACALSIPGAWYLMGEWLEKFPYRVPLTAWPFVLTSLAAIVITLVTVSFQAIRAGKMDPVKSLRSE